MEGVRPQSVSVALCTHNGAAFVEEQVASILHQRPAPLELIVGDDASTDDTVELIERSYRAARDADPAVTTTLKVIRRVPALGVIRNVEATISACSGDLIALSDQDDVWHEGRLAALAAAFADDPDLLLIHSDAQLIDEEGRPLGYTLLDALGASATERELLARGNALPVLLRRSLVTGATVMFSSRLRELAIPFPADWVHDEWLAVIAASVGRARLLPRQLTDYRQHAANQIGARRVTMADRWYKLREPRAARAAWLVRRTTALSDRGRALGVSDRIQAKLDGKAAHEMARGNLPRVHVLRVPGVVAGAISGRYARYSRGAIDVLRDLVQPAGEVDSGQPAVAARLFSGRER
jgi:glycosyltransferase involved in cell wall biosynthesis